MILFESEFPSHQMYFEEHDKIERKLSETLIKNGIRLISRVCKESMYDESWRVTRPSVFLHFYFECIREYYLSPNLFLVPLCHPLVLLLGE